MPNPVALRHEAMPLGLDHAQDKGVLGPQSEGEEKSKIGRDMLALARPKLGLQEASL